MNKCTKCKTQLTGTECYPDGLCGDCYDHVINTPGITFDQVERWLGSESPIEEAIETILGLVNGDYTLENIRADIKNHIESGEK